MAEDNNSNNWKHEISAGGVVYKKDQSQTFVLLIQPMGRNFSPPEGYWTFPKGKQDKPGEDLTQVAVREVREEGGVEAVVAKELGTVEYLRDWPGDEARKTVHYFLMNYQSGDPQNHDREVFASEWVDINEVSQRLKFDTDKEVFNKARVILDSKF